MMDIETIKQVNKEAGKNAQENNIKPLVFNSVDMDKLKHNDIEPIRTMPDVGDSVPSGWNRFNLGKIKDQFKYSYKIYKDDANGYGAFFVDQGFGSENEPAMTIKQFINSLSQLWNNPNIPNNKKLGYGIVETGQFQVKIGIFQKVA